MIRFGVMGASGGEFSPSLIASCRELGKAIAQTHNCLLTGACPGLPQEVVLGARANHGHIIGISPASSESEHITLYDSPIKEFDVMIYTGLGLMGRELINIRSSDIVVIVGGSSGTLGEFAIAFEEGKLIGVLEHSGGIADLVKEIVPKLANVTGSEVLYDSDALTLTQRLIIRHKDRTKRSSQITQVTSPSQMNDMEV